MATITLRRVQEAAQRPRHHNHSVGFCLACEHECLILSVGFERHPAQKFKCPTCHRDQVYTARGLLRLSTLLLEHGEFSRRER